MVGFGTVVDGIGIRAAEGVVGAVVDMPYFFPVDAVASELCIADEEGGVGGLFSRGRSQDGLLLFLYVSFGQ